MQTTLQELLATNETILLDGAMGTILFELGLQHGDSPELWNIEQADKIRSVHRQYIEAGSQLILTNTFGCNRKRLELHKLSGRATELNMAAAKLARAEADAASPPILVAGDIGPSGSILIPYGEMEYEEAVEVFTEQAKALVEGGVDVLWIETMSDLGEIKAAIEACKNVAPEIPIIATMTFDTHGRTMFGVKPEQALEALHDLAVVALGGNCGNGTKEIETVIEKMRATNPDVTLIAKANAGIPHLENGVAVYDAQPEDMGEYARNVLKLGATFIGACCGSTPAHIRAMAVALGKAIPTL
jgi:5-methyltetrahydrofolate--homocysteine methyltransferase